MEGLINICLLSQQCFVFCLGFCFVFTQFCDFPVYAGKGLILWFWSYGLWRRWNFPDFRDSSLLEPCGHWFICELHVVLRKTEQGGFACPSRVLLWSWLSVFLVVTEEKRVLQGYDSAHPRLCPCNWLCWSSETMWSKFHQSNIHARAQYFTFILPQNSISWNLHDFYLMYAYSSWKYYIDYCCVSFHWLNSVIYFFLPLIMLLVEQGEKMCGLRGVLFYFIF